MLANLVYLGLLVALSPWILYRCVRHGRYRRGVRQKLFGVSASEAKRLLGPTGNMPCIWIHAVSVGEINLIGGLIHRLQKLDPHTPIVVSTSTDTGYDVARKKYGHERVFFCPLDFSWAVRRTLANLRPRMLMLAELELWPNLVTETRRCGADVVVVNARLSPKSMAGYRRLQWLTRPIFQSLSHVICQDTTTAERFALCGTPTANLSCSGSLKFDDAPHSRDNFEVQTRLRWAGIDPWHSVWIVGSTQEGEEQMALNIYRRLIADHPELRLIMVPRHPERFDSVSGQIEAAGLKSHRRSTDGSMENETWNGDRVILIDSIGELRHWWGVGQIATVGGSFGDRGGQNMLEPAGYGSAVSFGPNTQNFADIADSLLQAGGAVRVHQESELEAFVRRCLEDLPASDQLGMAAKAVIEKHRGATDRTLKILRSILGDQPASARRAA